jgi:outer membrane protein with beta-barrel domain
MRMLPVAALTAVLASAACADETDAEAGRSRFYAGLGIATLELADEHRGVAVDGSSVGLAPYAGIRLLENVDLEIAYLRFGDLGLHDIAGSGTVRLDVDTRIDTATVRAVGRLSLSEWLEWPRDWRVYGSAGYYSSTVRRDVTQLASGAHESARATEAGLVLGAGALHAIGPVDLRGYVQWFGVLDRGEAREIGVAAQIRF